MGLTRRLIAAALALGLGGATAPAGGASTPPMIRPLAGVRTWVVYYGAEASAGPDLARFDVVVLDPHGHLPLPVIKRHGAVVLTYVSLGEVNTSHPEYAGIKDEPWVLAPNPSWPDARRLDVRAEGYQRWLQDRVIPAALAGPVNGLFLDTADSALDLEHTDPARHAGMARALERVLGEMKRRNPRALLMLNGGLPVAERLSQTLDAVALESIWSDYDFKAQRYRVRPAEEAEARAGLLARVAALGLPVFTIEYAAAEPGGHWPAELIRRSRARGFVPYVATIGLDRVSLLTLSLP